LCLSCCYSEGGYNTLRPLLKGHFTGAYYFVKETIRFATAMTVWSMFYLHRIEVVPARRVEKINTFLGEEVIRYCSV